MYHAIRGRTAQLAVTASFRACEDNAPPALLFIAARDGRSSLSPLVMRGGPERRVALRTSVHALRREHPFQGARRAALQCGDFWLRAPRFRAETGAGPSRGPLPSRRLPPPFVSASVQPFKAAGHSAGGRLARASRARGYKPRPRAPHPVLPSACLATTPLSGPDSARIVIMGLKSRAPANIFDRAVRAPPDQPAYTGV